MKGLFPTALAVVAALALASCRGRSQPEESALVAEQPTQHGTIKGHVRLTGKPPENPPIRMRSDPMCDKANGGKPAFQESVIAGPDGSLANVLVQLQGTFPGSTAPTAPVTIDQRACIYSPRVVGIQLGQPIRVLNSDPGLHNVHGVSKSKDEFNVGQPMAGMVNEFHLKDEGLLRLQCDVHTWMVSFVGVVNHPYFAVTSAPGTFELRDVPVGTHTIQAWHEQYGQLTASVRVDAGGIADVDFAYTGQEKPTAAVPTLTIEGRAVPARVEGAAVASQARLRF